MMQDTFGSSWGREGFVITTLKGGPMEPRTYSDKLDVIVRAIGIPHVNFHALRLPTCNRYKRAQPRHTSHFWRKAPCGPAGGHIAIWHR